MLQPSTEQLRGRALAHVFPWVANQLGRFLPGYNLGRDAIESTQAFLRTIDAGLVTTTTTAFGDLQLGLDTFWGLAWTLVWGLIIRKVHTTAVRLNRFGWTILSCLDVLVVAWTPQYYYYYFTSWYVLTLLAAWVCRALGEALRAGPWLGLSRPAMPDSSTTSSER
jgi:hypothetical protein